MSDDLDALLDLAGEHAARILVELKEPGLTPMLLAITPTEQIFAPMEWRDEADKQTYLKSASLILKLKGATRYSIVSEAWTAVQPKGAGPYDGPPPADRPDRKEIVIAIAADKTTSKSRVWGIVRGEAGTIVKLEPDAAVLTGLGGRMAELLR